MPEKMFNPEPGMSFDKVPEEKKKYFKSVDEKGGYVRKSAIENPEEAREDSFKIKLARTARMEWVPGQSDVVHDYKEPWRGGEDRNYQTALTRGAKKVAGSSGTYVVIYPGHFILNIRVEDSDQEIWTERDFKLALGIDRMTKKVRDIIASKMPSEIKVEERVGQKGRKYYRATEDDILKWAKEVGGLL